MERKGKWNALYATIPSINVHTSKCISQIARKWFMVKWWKKWFSFENTHTRTLMLMIFVDKVDNQLQMCTIPMWWKETNAQRIPRKLSRFFVQFYIIISKRTLYLSALDVRFFSFLFVCWRGPINRCNRRMKYLREVTHGCIIRLNWIYKKKRKMIIARAMKISRSDCFSYDQIILIHQQFAQYKHCERSDAHS